MSYIVRYMNVLNSMIMMLIGMLSYMSIVYRYSIMSIDRFLLKFCIVIEWLVDSSMWL